jgi:hypothetical protein
MKILKLIPLLLFIFLSGTTTSQTIFRTVTSTGIKAWSSTSTWQGGVVPPTNGTATVYISAATGTYSINNNVYTIGTINVKDIIVENGANMELFSGTTTIVGDLINNGTIFTRKNTGQGGTSTIRIGRNLTTNTTTNTFGNYRNATDTNQTLIFDFNGSGSQIINGTSPFNVVGKTVSVTFSNTSVDGITIDQNFNTTSPNITNTFSPVTINSGVTVKFGDSTRKFIGGGSITLNGLTELSAPTFNEHYAVTGTRAISTATSTITYKNSNSIITPTVNIPTSNLGSLIVDIGNNTLTLSSNLNINQNFTLNTGTLVLNGFRVNRVTAGGTLSLNNTSTLVIRDNDIIPSNYTTHIVHYNNTINYNGSNQSVVLLNSNQSYGNLILSGTGTKTFASNTGTKISGNFTLESGAVTVPDMLTFNGPSTQNIIGLSYNNLHFAGSGTKTFTSDASIKSDKAITFDSGITGTIDFDGPSNDKVFTLKSDVNGTARIGIIPVNGSGVANVNLAGKVKVERFIPKGKRAFRFLTPGVTTDNFIRANWQNNGQYEAGIGTHITGSSSALGFDVTATGNPSMFFYNNQVASGTGWTQIPNTNATNLLAGMAYRILIRGDRTSTLITNTSQPEMNVATTLSATGILTTGRVTYNATTTPAINTTNNTTTNGFSLIGNPYVSPIDWYSVEVSNMQNVYYAWDPNMGNNTQRGRYVAYNKDTGSNSVPTSQVNRFIQPGQAFFVKIVGANPSITFNESHKASTFTNVFREASMNYTKLKISLFEPAELGIGGYALDGVVALFDDSFSNTVDFSDVAKMEAGGENLAIFGNNLKWAMQGSSPIQNNDELLLKTLRLVANKNYTFKINAVNLDPNVTAYLVDNFLATTTPINLTQDYFANFATTSVVASYNEDRFKIVFQVGTLTGSDFEINNSVIIYTDTNINIKSVIENIKSVQIFDLLGRNIATFNDVNSAQFTSNSMKQSKLPLAIKVTLQNGLTKSYKIIY